MQNGFCKRAGERETKVVAGAISVCLGQVLARVVKPIRPVFPK
jgi:hypothetical protein